jgi:hypothetical protein
VSVYTTLKCIPSCGVDFEGHPVHPPTYRGKPRCDIASGILHAVGIVHGASSQLLLQSMRLCVVVVTLRRWKSHGVHLHQASSET